MSRLTLNTDGLTGVIDIGAGNVEGWRDCSVSVNAAGFCAEFVCEVRDEELQEFLQQLEAATGRLGREADINFIALEGVRMMMHLDRRGHVEGGYEFSAFSPHRRLSGSFSADQTHLCGWAKELRMMS